MRWSWPTARAVILCVVVAGNLLQALPFPRREVEEDDEEEWRAGDVEMWHRWLSELGAYRGSAEQFQGQVVEGYNVLATVGSWVQWPTRPVFRMMASTQQWGLFGVVTETPERLLVEVRIDGEWVLVEQRLHAEHDWMDEVFRYRRVRGTWDTVKKGKPAPLFDAFCRWTARKAFVDYPTADRVRVAREQFPVAAPWETLTRGPERLQEQEISRDDDRLWVLR